LGVIHQLQNYKLAFFNKPGSAVVSTDFLAVDDIAALAHAFALCGADPIAVTQEGRRVGEVSKGGLAPKVAAVA
jgi:hypothetical protein